MTECADSHRNICMKEETSWGGNLRMETQSPPSGPDVRWGAAYLTAAPRPPAPRTPGEGWGEPGCAPWLLGADHLRGGARGQRLWRKNTPSPHLSSAKNRTCVEPTRSEKTLKPKKKIKSPQILLDDPEKKRSKHPRSCCSKFLSTPLTSSPSPPSNRIEIPQLSLSLLPSHFSSSSSSVSLLLSESLWTPGCLCAAPRSRIHDAQRRVSIRTLVISSTTKKLSDQLLNWSSAASSNFSLQTLIYDIYAPLALWVFSQNNLDFYQLQSK